MDQQARYDSRRGRGARFESEAVARLYELRPPYPEETYTQLKALIESPRVVLDAGCGTGKIARRLLQDADRIDAVDPSASMLSVGRRLPGGEDAKLRWIESTIEEAPLVGPYGLAVAGASFHWFDADEVLPKLARLLAPSAVLALVDGDAPCNPPWAELEHELFMAFASRIEGRPQRWERVGVENLRLLDHPLFERIGEQVSAPTSVDQSIDDYVAMQHSRASFSMQVMGVALAAEFDAALRDILTPWSEDGRVTYDRRTRIEWGYPRE